MKGKPAVFLLLTIIVIAVMVNWFERKPTSKVVWQLVTDKDYVGPVRRGAVDELGHAAYLATRVALYRVRAGQVQSIAQRPEEEAQLAIAPSGGLYAWMIPRSDWRGLFFIRLMDLSGQQLAELRLKDSPYGFGTLYLGFQGRLILTASPLNDWEGLGGRFLYTFWSRQGKRLADVVLTRHVGFPEPSGTAIVLLGEREAISFSASGQELWRLPGRFRNAASARNGKFALLNPAESIDQVLIFDGTGKPTVVTVPTPVHDLRMVADGSLALVVGDQGHYWYLNPATGDLREGPRPPLDGVFYISDAEFVDQDTVALSFLHRRGEPPAHSWPKGTIVVLNRAGNVAYQQSFDIREPLAFIPAIDTTFGSSSLIGFTEDTAVLVELGR
ncbi:MAG TPA: hypothetical protein VLU73_09750 [Methylococcaceae bacterium]|jgi:hypothetical protein|nr:hypothetical protein [Methylococcaceae bacterium]